MCAQKTILQILPMMMMTNLTLDFKIHAKMLLMSLYMYYYGGGKESPKAKVCK